MITTQRELACASMATWAFPLMAQVTQASVPGLTTAVHVWMCSMHSAKHTRKTALKFHINRQEWLDKDKKIRIKWSLMCKARRIARYFEIARNSSLCVLQGSNAQANSLRLSLDKARHRMHVSMIKKEGENSTNDENVKNRPKEKTLWCARRKK